MNRIVLTILMCLSLSVLKAQTVSYQALISQADSLYKAKNYAQSIRIYEQAFQVQKDNRLHLYNAACSAALAGEKQNAFNLLGLALDKGWINVVHLKKDLDLVSLHAEKDWQPLVARMQAKIDEQEARYNKPLQAELLQLHEADQSIRQFYTEAGTKYGYQHRVTDSLGRIMMHTDSLNILKLRKILDTYGWVGKDIVGEKANQCLFLVIQHSDLPVQQHYLPMMREAVQKGNATASSLALLEDRIALREGRKQIYGSQIGQDPKTGTFYVKPLEDPDHVDQRRKQVGLGPIDDYVKLWNIRWNVEEYKAQQAPSTQKVSGNK